MKSVIGLFPLACSITDLSHETATNAARHSSIAVEVDSHELRYRQRGSHDRRIARRKTGRKARSAVARHFLEELP